MKMKRIMALVMTSAMVMGTLAGCGASTDTTDTTQSQSENNSTAAAAATDIVGKVWAIFFPIMAFVVGGFEHCVANMFYIPVGMMAAQNPAYVAKAQEAYGLTAEQIQGLTVLHSLNNFIPVTIGNILGGMVFVGIPCYFIYKKKWQKWHEESKNA